MILGSLFPSSCRKPLGPSAIMKEIAKKHFLYSSSYLYRILFAQINCVSFLTLDQSHPVLFLSDQSHPSYSILINYGQSSHTDRSQTTLFHDDHSHIESFKIWTNTGYSSELNKLHYTIIFFDWFTLFLSFCNHFLFLDC